tara:strand:- start:853 stop:1485 length:633 start_codon:yes stop_codon:yes gene_type:complete
MRAVKGGKVGDLLSNLEKMPSNQEVGDRLLSEAMSRFPALRNLGDISVVPDREFTRDLTGIGDIEYYGPEQGAITYPSGSVVDRPSPRGRHTVLVNPDTNDSQAVALDLLHGMADSDPTFASMLREFGDSLDEGEIRYWYNKDREDGYAGDGYEQYRRNYVDGKLRNLLFEGSDEDFQRARYNPRERQDMQNYNPRAYEAFETIKSYLEK